MGIVALTVVSETSGIEIGLLLAIIGLGATIIFSTISTLRNKKQDIEKDNKQLTAELKKQWEQEAALTAAHTRLDKQHDKHTKDVNDIKNYIGELHDYLKSNQELTEKIAERVEVIEMAHSNEIALEIAKKNNLEVLTKKYIEQNPNDKEVIEAQKNLSQEFEKFIYKKK